MAPLYKTALVVGATSGIGEAMAKRFMADGTKVIAVGRRKDRLDSLVTPEARAAGHDAIPLDINQLSSVPSFAADVTARHPDLDCIVLNSGIQRAFDFTHPEAVDLSPLGDELTTNYLAQVHLLTAFLPHLQRLAAEGTPTYLIFISATLGLVPTLLRTPNYNASKAALHSFITALRQQLRDAGQGDNIRLVEVFPPAVQTELHDTKHQPDLVNGGEIGMPLAQFTEELFRELGKGLPPADMIGIGPARAMLEEGGLEFRRQQMFEEGHPIVTKALGKFKKQ